MHAYPLLPLHHQVSPRLRPLPRRLLFSFSSSLPLDSFPWKVECHQICHLCFQIVLHQFFLLASFLLISSSWVLHQRICHLLPSLPQLLQKAAWSAIYNNMYTVNIHTWCSFSTSLLPHTIPRLMVQFLSSPLLSSSPT